MTVTISKMGTKKGERERERGEEDIMQRHRVAVFLEQSHKNSVSVYTFSLRTNSKTIVALPSDS